MVDTFQPTLPGRTSDISRMTGAMPMTVKLGRRRHPQRPKFCSGLRRYHDSCLITYGFLELPVGRIGPLSFKNHQTGLSFFQIDLLPDRSRRRSDRQH
jgi:hypothetical protein